MKKWLPFMLGAGVVLGVLSYWFHTRTYSAEELVQMLPPDRSLHVYLDVAMLRQAGILDQIAGSPALEADEYRAFVQGTGVNYRTDLDAVAIGFRDNDRFIALQGRFDWDRISNYAQVNGGACIDGQCLMRSENLSRHTLSFYMPRADVLAFATAESQTANEMIAPGTWEDTPDVPDDAALWALAPPYVFTDLGDLPAGTRSFISPLADATQTEFTLGPSEDLESFVLRMAVDWPDAEAAQENADELRETTELLRSMIARQNMTPNAADLSGVLTSGTFTSEGTQMTASWPISPEFFETLLSDGPAPGDSQ